MTSLNLESQVAREGLTAWLADPAGRAAVFARREANILRGQLEVARTRSPKTKPDAQRRSRPSIVAPGTTYARVLPLMTLHRFIGDAPPCSREELQAIYNADENGLYAAPYVAEKLLHGRKKANAYIGWT